MTLLEEFGLSFSIALEVIDKVIELSHHYRDSVDSLIESISKSSLIDFNWSLRVCSADRVLLNR